MNAASPSLRACFDELADLTPSQREAWFAAHALDAELRRELLEMLAADLDDAPLLSMSAAAPGCSLCFSRMQPASSAPNGA